jgi:hypothetical protein
MIQLFSSLQEYYDRKRLTKHVVEQNYAVVLQKLRAGTDPNLALDVQVDVFDVKMTGMEYATYRLDWKMFLVFFLAKADPAKNVFNGSMQLEVAGTARIRSRWGAWMNNSDDVLEETQQQPIPGFRGLWAIHDHELHSNILDPEHNHSPEDLAKLLENARILEAALWLAERLHERSMDVHNDENISQTRSHLVGLDPEYDWFGAYEHKASVVNDMVPTQFPDAAADLIIRQFLPRSEILLEAIQECLSRIVEKAARES